MTTYYPQNMKYIVALLVTAMTGVTLYLLYKELRTVKVDIVELKKRSLHHLEVMNAHEQQLIACGCNAQRSGGSRSSASIEEGGKGDSSNRDASASQSSDAAALPSDAAALSFASAKGKERAQSAPAILEKKDKGKKSVQFADPIAVESAIHAESSSPFGIPLFPSHSPGGGSSSYFFIEQVGIPPPPPPPQVFMNESGNDDSHEEEITSYWTAIRSELETPEVPSSASIEEVVDEDTGKVEDANAGPEAEPNETQPEGPPPVLPAPDAGTAIQVTPICVEVVKTGRRKGELCGRDAITPDGKCRMHVPK